MNLSLGQTNLVYVNPRYGEMQDLLPPALSEGEWRNYGGSKVWPAPQGWSGDNQWPGPPDAVLDGGPYKYEVRSDDNRASIHLESEHDEYSGITLERVIEIHSGTSIVHLNHTMRNTSRQRVRWSIWQVTQLDAAGCLEVFIPATGFRRTFGNEPYPEMTYEPAQKRAHLRYQDQVAKFAVKADLGWFASLDTARDVVLAETFPISSVAEYPDGTPVALWTSGRGTFTLHGDTIDLSVTANGCDPHVETEIMGPLTELAPGQSSEFSTEWRLAAIDATEIVSVNDCGAVGRPLTLSAGSSSRLTGAFGVFYEARLQLVSFDRRSRPVGTLPLGEVTPLRPVVLDESICLPESAVRCSLWLLNEHNQRLGTLDHVQIR
jgi:hypothetical protein